VDFVARNEFDFTIQEVASDRPWSQIQGLSYRNAKGVITHNPDRPMLESMDDLPFVTPVYQRDLKIENYFIGYLQHPYLSLYTGRGCPARCTRAPGGSGPWGWRLPPAAPGSAGRR